MTIYCPLCNKSSDEIRFVGNFCEECIIKKLEKKIPENCVLLQCRFCKRIKEGKTFSKMGNKSVARSIKISLKIPDEIKVKFHTDEFIDAIITSIVENEKVSFPKRFMYKIKHETCQRCYWIASGYYEAVVQLRGNRFRIDNLVKKLKKYIERRDGFIAKIENVENNGVDVYTSNKLMMNDFIHDYDLKATRSYRLYGMKRGKSVYRNTYSLHL
jgi:nonsense-mediated mRNA decay protein 3